MKQLRLRAWLQLQNISLTHLQSFLWLPLPASAAVDNMDTSLYLCYMSFCHNNVNIYDDKALSGDNFRQWMSFPDRNVCLFSSSKSNTWQVKVYYSASHVGVASVFDCASHFCLIRASEWTLSLFTMNTSLRLNSALCYCKKTEWGWWTDPSESWEYWKKPDDTQHTWGLAFLGRWWTVHMMIHSPLFQKGLRCDFMFQNTIRCCAGFSLSVWTDNV